MIIKAAVLSAGASSRMGEPKALLKINGKNFIQIITEKIRKAGIKDICIVLGSNAEALRNSIGVENVRILVNRDWEKGQLSSLKTAVRNTGSDTDSLLAALIDHPMIKTDTIVKIIDSYRKSRADIVIPDYKGRGGHPVLYSRNVFKGLMEAPLSEGARAVVRSTEYIVERVDVDDPFIRQDIDTVKEYKEIAEKNIPENK